MFSPLWYCLSLATHLAGSQYWTWESCKPVVTSVFGLVLGPFLVASSTDFIFQDPNAVAKSLALVSVLIGPVGIFFMLKGVNAFGEMKNV